MQHRLVAIGRQLRTETPRPRASPTAATLSTHGAKNPLWPSQLLSVPLERVQQRTAKQVMVLLIPQVMEELSRPSELPLRSVFLRLSQHMVDVSIPQVFGQHFVVPNISSQDRILQCTVEQVSRCCGDADRRPVGGCADTVFQDRIQQRTPHADLWHPSSAGSEGTLGSLQGFFFEDRVQQGFFLLAISLAEKISEMLQGREHVSSR